MTQQALRALAIGTGAAMLLSLVPRRVAAGFGLIALTALVMLVARAPADPYFAQSLQGWEQGRFIRFHGAAQWVGWIWPYAGVIYLLARLAARDAEPWRRALALGASAGAAAPRGWRRLAQRGIDQRVGHPQGDPLDLAVGKAPDVLQDHVRLDAVDDRQRAVQPLAHGAGKCRRERRERVLEDAHAMAAPVRLLLEQAGALERPLLERELRGGAHLRLELLEAREGLANSSCTRARRRPRSTRSCAPGRATCRRRR